MKDFNIEDFINDYNEAQMVVIGIGSQLTSDKYGEMSADKKGKLTFKVPENEKLVYLWLVVMGAPEEHWINPSPESGEKDAQWPYRIRLKGTDLKN